MSIAALTLGIYILANEVLYWIRIIRESDKYNIVWPKLKGLSLSGQVESLYVTLTTQ